MSAEPDVIAAGWLCTGIFDIIALDRVIAVPLIELTLVPGLLHPTISTSAPIKIGVAGAELSVIIEEPPSTLTVTAGLRALPIIAVWLTNYSLILFDVIIRFLINN